MNNITIFIDSCSSLTEDIIQKHNIKVIPVYFTLNEEEYNPLESKISVQDFYDTLESGTVARTACINPSIFYDEFKTELELGNDVLYIAMSSGLSATYQNAVNAKEQLLKDYPNKIEIIDSLKGGMGMAFDVIRASELKEQGLSLSEIKEQLDKNALDVECLFTPGSISYLKRSGRIKPPAALLARVININPLIIADKLGKLSIKSLCMGRKKTLVTLINRVKSVIHDTFRKIYICYTNNKQEADFVHDQLKKDVQDVEINVSTIDCSLGCHCGPKTLAVFFRRKVTG